MKNKIKNSWAYVLCAGIGLLNFILLAITYTSEFYSYEYDRSYGYGYGFSGSGSYSYGISGYRVMSLWGFGFGGVISSLLQIFILLTGIALLAWGTMGLLKSFGVFEKFPDAVGGKDSKKLGEWGLLMLAGLNVLLLIGMIIFTASNTETVEIYGGEESSGFKLSAGIFISIVFTVGAYVALKILQKKCPAGEQLEEAEYLCEKCGKKAKKKDKFCNECGGAVIKKEKAAAKEEAGSIEDVIPQN